MRTTIFALLITVFVGLSFASSPATSPDDRPLDDTRLTIHTLIREDIFAGWRANNMERLERGEANIEKLLEKRPEARADLLAWQAGIRLFRAALAHEAGKADECETLYQEALDLIKSSRDADAESAGAASVIGGSYALFTDRLPESLHDDCWEACYECFHIVYRIQSDYVDQLPVHMRGELLAGLTLSSHRTGRMEEYEKFRDQIIEVLPKTAYGRVASRWKENPEAAKTENISCKSCHAEGRLTATLNSLDNK